MFDPKLISQLRSQTGAGVLDCRKALEEAGGDYEKAIDLLRKKGQKVAASNKNALLMKELCTLISTQAAKSAL
jgi:elongation factor Ts